MAYTRNCDIYFAIQETGTNLVALHVMRQRPSLFNYASRYIATHSELWCIPVQRTSDVDNYNPNNIFIVEPAIPIFGATTPPVSLNFCAQLVAAALDFYPSSVFNLLAEMNLPLQPQQFALGARLCGGLDCPSELIADIAPGSPVVTPVTVYVPPQTLISPTRKLRWPSGKFVNSLKFFRWFFINTWAKVREKISPESCGCGVAVLCNLA